MNAKQELDEWLDNTSEKVQRNVDIVTPEDLKQDYLVHVSPDTNIKAFIPMIGRRQAPMEDRTVPRICVTPTLLGSISGYADMENVFHGFVTGEKNEFNATYKGGLKIYTIPFKAALKPSQKLVYDAKHSEEMWLVAYSKETALYKPESAGKVFIESIRYKAREGKSPEADVTMYVEVTKEDGIQFSKGLFLEKGYWSIEGPAPMFTTMTWSEKTHARHFNVKEIQRADYQAVKQRSAALLSADAPTWTKW